MRNSAPILTHDEAMAIEAGAPIRIKNYVSGPDLKVRSLKNLNRDAYDNHMVEISIGEYRTVVNAADFTQALRYV